MAAASKAVATALSKPETYVAICVTDKHEAMTFGGTADPCALGCVYSIGQINQENNGALTLAISELLEKHGGVPNNRIYINVRLQHARPRTYLAVDSTLPLSRALCDSSSTYQGPIVSLRCSNAPTVNQPLTDLRSGRYRTGGWSGRTFAG